VSSQLFPTFLKLKGRPALLVGGGKVAAGKLRSLLDAGANVTLVAPQIREELELPGVILIRRPFEARDLDGQWFAIAAAPGAVNREVAQAAEERRIFVNAVDDLSSASAYLSGVVRKAGITLAISTEGRAPAIAGLLREGLEQLLPDDLVDWVALSERLRIRWLTDQVPISERRPLLLRALEQLYATKSNPRGIQ